MFQVPIMCKVFLDFNNIKVVGFYLQKLLVNSFDNKKENVSVLRSVHHSVFFDSSQTGFQMPPCPEVSSTRMMTF